MYRLLFPLVFLVFPGYCWPGREQHVNVTGRLLCHGKPAAGVTVILAERDWPDRDDIMASTKTTANGTYSLAGKEVESFNIQPYIAIGHFCQPKKAAGKQCLRTISLELPETVIGHAQPAVQVRMAEIHLEHERQAEKVACGKQATPENILFH